MALPIYLISNNRLTFEISPFFGDNHKLYFNELEIVDTIKYGALYNWYAATDARNLTPVGFKIPAKADFEALLTYLGEGLVAQNKLKEIGTTYWITGNGNNLSKFNARGSGNRNNSGIFNGIKGLCWIVCTDQNTIYPYNLWINDTTFGGISWTYKTYGFTVRPLKITTTLTNGQSGTYIGNDGKVYRTICIGTQEWLADNLSETKFRDGSLIPIVTDNSAWSTLDGIHSIATTRTSSIVTYGGYPSAPVILSQKVTLPNCNIKSILLNGDAANPGTDYKIRLNIYSSVDNLPVTKLFESTNTISANIEVDNIFLFDNVFLASGDYSLVTSYEDIIVFDDAHNMNFATNNTDQYTTGKLAYFANGSWIVSDVLDLLGTINYTSAAMCYYNNDINNA